MVYSIQNQFQALPKTFRQLFSQFGNQWDTLALYIKNVLSDIFSFTSFILKSLRKKAQMSPKQSSQLMSVMLWQVKDTKV